MTVREAQNGYGLHLPKQSLIPPRVEFKPRLDVDDEANAAYLYLTRSSKTEEITIISFEDEEHATVSDFDRKNGRLVGIEFTDLDYVNIDHLPQDETIPDHYELIELLEKEGLSPVTDSPITKSE